MKKVLKGILIPCLLFVQSTSVLAQSNGIGIDGLRIGQVHSSTTETNNRTAVDIVTESGQNILEQSSFRAIGNLQYDINIRQNGMFIQDRFDSLKDGYRVDRSELSEEELYEYELRIIEDQVNAMMEELMEVFLSSLRSGMDIEMLVDYDTNRFYQVMTMNVMDQQLKFEVNLNDGEVFHRDNFMDRWQPVQLLEEDYQIFAGFEMLLSSERMMQLSDLFRLSSGVDEDGNEFYRVAVNFNENGMIGVINDYVPEIINGAISMSDLSEMQDQQQDMRLNVGYVSYIDAETLLPINTLIDIRMIVLMDDFGEKVTVHMNITGEVKFEDFGEHFDFPVMPRRINSQGRIE